MKLARAGVEIVEDVVDSTTIEALTAALPESVAGQRHLLQRNELVRSLAESPAIQTLLVRLNHPGTRPVRAVFFDKNPANNWKVPWHQDLTIAVAERREAAGFHSWSVKDGVLHVQPPVTLLERMVTLRLHLDDCGPANGPLRVIPGSQDRGRLTPEAIREASRETETICCMRRGGVVAMKPLVLHASSPAENPSHRRVIHLEFSPDELPAGLAWTESLPTARSSFSSCLS